MNEPFFPPPSIDPIKNLRSLERLRVYDSLMINADRWRKAHEYHRQRQNIHYQSLDQPGIVYGLGVRKIDAPQEVSAQFRNRLWVQVQPGIAIDWEGNPIVVPEAIDFPFTLPQFSSDDPLTVYLVVSFRDPENLSKKNAQETFLETFRLDQKTVIPIHGEVELCRILWEPGTTKIEKPQDVLFPKPNQLDLRYRLQAKSRPQANVRIGALDNLPQNTKDNLSSLMACVSALYPAFQGVEEVGSVLLRTQQSVADYDLFYLSDRDFNTLKEREFQILKDYLKTGGVLFIEAPTGDRSIESLSALIPEKLNIGSLTWENLGKDHPLRRQPFLFVALPEINRYPIEVWHDGGGIILVEGELSAAWGFDEELFLSRNDIRTAQEFGINLLHFAWQRRNLTDLLS